MNSQWPGQCKVEINRLLCTKRFRRHGNRGKYQRIELASGLTPVSTVMFPWLQVWEQQSDPCTFSLWVQPCSFLLWSNKQLSFGKVQDLKNCHLIYMQSQNEQCEWMKYLFLFLSGAESSESWYNEIKKYDFKSPGFHSGTGMSIWVLWTEIRNPFNGNGYCCIMVTISHKAAYWPQFYTGVGCLSLMTTVTVFTPLSL